MTTDMIPETRLAHRVRLTTRRTPVGDQLHTITCPGCGLDMRVIASRQWAVETAEGHAMECRALHDRTWQECSVCDGSGERCLACLGRGWERVA